MDKPVLLEVKDLKTYFYSGKHALKAVDSVSFSIREGEVFGLVGESGSGKSITCKSLIGLIHRPGRIAGGSIRYRGQELAGLSEKALTAVRGKEIGMIFQEPMVALNPVLRIGQQITESFKDPGLSGEEKHARAVDQHFSRRLPGRHGRGAQPFGRRPCKVLPSKGALTWINLYCSKSRT